MSSTFAIAQSGLAAAAAELAVSAKRVADAATGGLAPSHVELQAAAQGGVAASAEPPSDPLAEVRADRAVLAPSRTDLAQEMLAQLRAAAAYRANLAVLRTAQDVDGALFDLRS